MTVAKDATTNARNTPTGFYPPLVTEAGRVLAFLLFAGVAIAQNHQARALRAIATATPATAAEAPLTVAEVPAQTASALPALPGLRPDRHRPDQTPGPRSSMRPKPPANSHPALRRSRPAPSARRRLRPAPLRHTPNPKPQTQNHQPSTLQARFSPGSTAQPDPWRAPASEPPAHPPATTPSAQPPAKKQNA